MKRVLIELAVFVLLCSGAFAAETTVASIVITPEEAIVIAGEDITFTAQAADSEGNVIEAEITWEVEGEIGTIDQEGEFKAVSAGTGFVVANVGDVSAKAAVTVTEQEEGENGGTGGKGGTGGQGDESGDNGQDGESDDGGQGIEEGEPEPDAIFPDNPWVVVGETIQFEVQIAGADENADVLWEVSDIEIGTIVDNGLFTALKAGDTTVTASYGEISVSTGVTVTAEGPPEGQSGNTIRIQRQKGDGKITQFGSAITENNSVTIGGIPHPMNYLNGMKLFFPENSISDDIIITVKIPAFAKVNNQKKEVTFEGDIVTAVSFEVSVNGEVVSPFNFDIPVEVTLPYKKGLLRKLGIDPEELSMFFVGQNGELIQEGISNCSLQSGSGGEDSGGICGQVSHFSDVALAPQEGIPAAVEANALPEGYSLSQNFPNPFNPETTISYMLPEASHVTITVYSLLGQHVKTLLDNAVSAGNYSVTWDGTDQSGRRVTSGLYIYRIQAGNFTQSRKLMLMK